MLESTRYFDSSKFICTRPSGSGRMKGWFLLITIILSELNPSVLTLEIVTAITDLETDATIVILGELRKSQQIAYAALSCDLIQLKFAEQPKYADALKTLYKLVTLLRRSRTTRIYSSGRTASFLGMLAGFLAFVPKRVFTRHHGAENHLFNKKKGVLIDKATNFFATKIVAVSKVCKETLINRDFVSPDKIVVIHNSMDFEKFSLGSRHFVPRSIRRAFLANDSLTIGVIGRGVPGKGVDIALSAFALFLHQFPNAKLRLIGYRNMNTIDSLKAIEDIPPENLEIILESPNIHTEYQNFDLFLHLPESRDFESFGLVYLEAIASGVPSIFTLSGILDEISCPSNVRLVYGGRIEETYRAMLDFCHNPPISYEIESKAITSVFSIQDMRNRYTEILSK